MKKARPYLIGITGGSGSGKTSFIQSLRDRFTPEELCILSQDDFYRPRSDQARDEKGVINFDLPTSLDLKKFSASVLSLIKGNPLTVQEYTFNNNNKKPKTITFNPAPVMIIEGLFVFHLPQIRSLLDLKIYIEAKENLKVIRRIKRDQIERNYPLEDVLYRYEKHVLPSFERFILPHKDDVDIIINNNKTFIPALNMVCGYIHQLTLKK